MLWVTSDVGCVLHLNREGQAKQTEADADTTRTIKDCDGAVTFYLLTNSEMKVKNFLLTL
jgi:hypothetical protein